MSLFAKVKMSPFGGREMETITMSTKEMSRLEVMQKLEEKRMGQKEASRILGISIRHIKRLLKNYRQQGAVGLVSRHRGRTGNHRLQAEVKKKVLDLLKSKYQDFGPTMACEKLMVSTSSMDTPSCPALPPFRRTSSQACLRMSDRNMRS
jgi:transposase